jgi:hypothetical protein
MKHLLRLFLITAALVLAALKFTEAQLPAVYNSGSPAFVRLTDCTFTDSGGGITLAVDQSDTLIAYFTHEGNHIAGATPLRSSGVVSLVVYGPESGPGAPRQLTGIPAGETIKLAVQRGGRIYPAVADSVFLYELHTRRQRPSALVWRSLAIYHVYRLKIDFSTTIVVDRVPWLIFRDSQCPAFVVEYNQTIEHDFTVNYVQRNRVRRGDGSEWDRHFLANRTRMEVSIPRPTFSPGQYVRVERGDGHVVEGLWQRHYHFGDADYQRGHVVLRWFSRRYPGCPLESDPSVLVRYNLIFLPEPEQEWVMIKPPEDDDTVDLIPVEVNYDRLLAEDKYISIVVINDMVHAVNRLGQMATIRIREVGSTRWTSSFGVRQGSYRASSINVNSPRFSGRRFEVHWSSWRLEMAGVLNFQL